jgi:hypothetical protein
MIELVTTRADDITAPAGLTVSPVKPASILPTTNATEPP